MVFWPFSLLTRNSKVSLSEKYEDESENLHSSSDSEKECFEDRSSRNISPVKSDTLQESEFSSKNTYYSLPISKNIKTKLLNPTVPGNSSGKTSANYLNVALRPSHSSTAAEVTTRQEQKYPILPENKTKIEVLNFPGNATEISKDINTEKSCLCYEEEMSDISTDNEHNSSVPKCKKWNKVTRNKKKSKSETFHLSQSQASKKEFKTDKSYNSESVSHYSIQNKKSNNWNLRDTNTSNVITKNEIINPPLRNSSRDIVTLEPYLPPSIMNNSNIIVLHAGNKSLYYEKEMSDISIHNVQPPTDSKFETRNSVSKHKESKNLQVSQTQASDKETKTDESYNYKSVSQDGIQTKKSNNWKLGDINISNENEINTPLRNSSTNIITLEPYLPLSQIHKSDIPTLARFSCSEHIRNPVSIKRENTNDFATGEFPKSETSYRRNAAEVHDRRDILSVNAENQKFCHIEQTESNIDFYMSSNWSKSKRSYTQNNFNPTVGAPVWSEPSEVQNDYRPIVEEDDALTDPLADNAKNSAESNRSFNLFGLSYLGGTVFGHHEKLNFNDSVHEPRMSKGTSKP